MSDRKAEKDGDGRERDDGDGGGQKQGRETRHETFVFGRADSRDSRKASQARENDRGPRRPISLSYKEKLLSPGGLGYLVSHAEEEDIVNGWKGFFSRKNAEMEISTGGTESEKEEAVGDGPSSGYPILSVTSEQYTTWCRPWMNSLVIKLLGLSVPKHVLIDRVRRMWKPRQPLKVVPLSNDYYIVSFSSMEDRDYALYEGPWMIDDHYILVQRWRPNFNPWKAGHQRRIAVWVRIPDLPMEFCTVESLGIIGNMIGKMIKIDRSTSIYDKGEFARICVEIDLQQPLLPAFTAFGEDMQLVYEGLHLVCFGCGLYGHEQKKCPHSPVAANGDNNEHTKQRVVAETESSSGHLKQSVTDVDKNRGVPKTNVVEETLSGGDRELQEVVNGGSGTAVDTVSGEKLEKGGFTVATPDVGRQYSKMETPESAHGVTGGPQMILRRDMRRNNQSIADNVGLKSGIPETSQGVKKGGINCDTSRGISNGQKFKEGIAAGSVGLLTTTLNEKAKKKGEWVVVGSKRKKEERPKLYGKEKISSGRPKSKSKSNQKGVDHGGPSGISMTNGFASLNDLTNNASIMHGAMQVDVSKEDVLGSNSLNTVGPSHEMCNTNGEIVVDMGVGDAQVQIKKEEQAQLQNSLGSGLAPQPHVSFK
ncbi:hypothetical protein K1719_000021 [Acacia pycnantha]|nr:hypothetical protein K1719_000021 [Acacia pycnantha]